MSSESAPGVFADQARTMALLWGTRERSGRGPKPGLDVDTIVRAAITVADADGLAAVSMQRVATEVGVSAMALYRYLPGKAELVELMIDLAQEAPPALDGTAGGWRPKLAEWARRCFDLYLRHPWFLAASGGELRLMGPNQLAWLESALTALAETGLTRPERVECFLLLVGHVRTVAGSATGSAGPARARVEQWDAATAALLRERGDRYPEVLATVTAGAFGAERGDPLDFGVQRILDGVEAWLARR